MRAFLSACEAIAYSNCWEDPSVLLDTFPGSDGRFLSIASAGDNSFSLLTLNPEYVLALDRNASQIACAHLKKAAIQRCDLQVARGFLGVRHFADRVAYYRRNLRPALPSWVRDYWDDRPKMINLGIVAIGRFERYLKLYRRVLLPLVLRRGQRDRLMQPMPLVDQRRFFYEELHTYFKERLYRLFFRGAVLSRLGRSRAQHRFAEGDVGGEIVARLIRGLTEIPIADNPYLEYATFGAFRHNSPHYLSPSAYYGIQANLDRLELRVGDLSEVLPQLQGGRFSGLNLSDIFESMSELEYRSTMELIRTCLVPGAVLVYWNMLVTRSSAAFGVPGFISMDEVARRHYKTSRSFFYKRLVVEAVAA